MEKSRNNHSRISTILIVIAALLFVAGGILTARARLEIRTDDME